MIINESQPQAPERRGLARVDASGSRPVVVVVEDDEALARVVWRAFELQGFDVHVASTVDESRAVIERVNPSVVVCDLVQPEDFYETVDDRMPFVPKPIPILVLSSDSDPERRRRVFHSGADAFLVKPMGLDALYGFVDALLARTVGWAPTNEGDPLAAIFRGICSGYKSYIQGLLYGQNVRWRDGVQECVDDTLMALWKGLPRFVRYDEEAGAFVLDCSNDHIKSWLASATKKVALTRRRGAARHAKKLERLAQEVRNDPPGERRLSDAAMFELRDFLALTTRAEGDTVRVSKLIRVR